MHGFLSYATPTYIDKGNGLEPRERLQTHSTLEGHTNKDSEIKTSPL